MQLAMYNLACIIVGRQTVAMYEEQSVHSCATIRHSECELLLRDGHQRCRHCVAYR